MNARVSTYRWTSINNTGSKRWTLFLLLVGVLLLICQTLGFADESSAEEKKPNFLIIVTDDQRFGTVEPFMPFTWNEIFQKGAEFKNGYVTTPSCCPSRASIMTGMYASRHGVKANAFPLLKPTMLNHLKDAGYYTGLVGKYLNTWGGEPRSEMDYWVSFRGGSIKYLDPMLNVNGEWIKHDGHVTYIFGDYVEDFLTEAAGQDKPFVMLFTPNAPHRPITVTAEHAHLYKNMGKHRPASWNPNQRKLKREGKPGWIQNLPKLKTKRVANIDKFVIEQAQAVRSLDMAIEDIFSLLHDLNLADDTIVFFVSDNGYIYGEHGLQGKDIAYEEAIHVPFAVWGKRAVPEPAVYSHLVANIDIAATIYDAAGIDPGEAIDGRSLLPIFEGSPYWRKELLIEGWRNNQRARRPYRAAHDGRFVYIKTRRGEPELYDLGYDPLQTVNLAEMDGYADRAISMRSSLGRMAATAKAGA